MILPAARRRSGEPGLGYVLVLVLALGTATSGCAYFNAVYNANRLVEEADRAAERGDTASARAAYQAAAEKGERGYARDPGGRWADDALFVTGRARFAAGMLAAAREPLKLLLADWPASPYAEAARAYLGAVEAAAGHHAAAIELLDPAVAALPPGAAEAGLARLWRARARLSLGAVGAGQDGTELALARADLEAAAGARDPVRRAAILELARIELALAGEPPDLATPRGRLAEIEGDRTAERLLDGMDELDRWLALAEQPGAELALFAAAELARDRLGARRLAAHLFRSYAAAHPDEIWAPKALLAALALGTSDRAELRRRLAGSNDNVYVAAARGEPVGDAYEEAERLLDRSLSLLASGAGRAIYLVRPAPAPADTPERRP